LSDLTLRALVAEVAHDLDPFAPLPFGIRREPPSLCCPHCTMPMRPTRFAAMPIDRCDHAQHPGVWLDDGELAAILERCWREFVHRDRPTPMWGADARTHWVPQPEDDRY
jgi:Zn-finger nucleic acid-binding protein